MRAMLKEQLDIVKRHRERIKNCIQWLKKQPDLDIEMIRRLGEDQASLTSYANRLRDSIRKQDKPQK